MSKLNEPLIKADLHPLMILWREEDAMGDEKQDCSTRRENDAIRSSSSSDYPFVRAVMRLRNYVIRG
jgi:hypothetical protein